MPLATPPHHNTWHCHQVMPTIMARWIPPQTSSRLPNLSPPWACPLPSQTSATPTAVSLSWHRHLMPGCQYVFIYNFYFIYIFACSIYSLLISRYVYYYTCYTITLPLFILFITLHSLSPDFRIYSRYYLLFLFFIFYFYFCSFFYFSFLFWSRALSYPQALHRYLQTSIT